MSTARRPPRQVPTLTEVVELPASAAPASSATLADPQPQPPAAPAQPIASAVAPAATAAAPAPPPADAPPAALNAADEERMVQRVLADLQRHIDLMLEYRLRESLSPMLAKLTDELARDARTSVATALRELVVKAVAQELSRRRGPK